MGGIRELQMRDPKLEPYFAYREQKILPDDEKSAKRMAAEQAYFEIEDKALYWLEPNGMLRLIPPTIIIYERN